MSQLTNEEYDLLRHGGQTPAQARESLIEVQSQLALCPDPECVDQDGDRSLAEPEQDGSHTYYACLTCGMEFGWALMAQTDGGTCSIGVPESVRRQFADLSQPTGTPVAMGVKPQKAEPLRPPATPQP